MNHNANYIAEWDLLKMTEPRPTYDAGDYAALDAIKEHVRKADHHQGEALRLIADLEAKWQGCDEEAGDTVPAMPYWGSGAVGV